MKHKPSKNQIEVLLLISPNPLGEGLTEEEAAERLGVSQQAISDRVNTFKENFPQAYKNWQGIMSVKGNSVRNPILMDNEDIVFFERVGKVKEVF